MNRDLPPLNALRAFEATARHQSISKASEELNVTPGAVSRQIQTLENWLGVRLFIRHHRHIELTDFAKSYYSTVKQSFDAIHQATSPLVKKHKNTPLKICSFPTFTQKWLISRWNLFYKQHPQIDIQFVTSLEPSVDHLEECDAIICVGDETSQWSNCQSLKIFDISIMAVCSPDFMKDHAGKLSTLDLPNTNLIRAGTRPNDWKRWLADAEIPTPENCETGPFFENYNLAIQAAIEGVGILVADTVLLEDDLNSGRLVQAFPHIRQTKHAFYLVFPNTNARDLKLKTLINWLKSELKLNPKAAKQKSA